MYSVPLFKPDSDWTPPSEPPRLDNVKVLAIDTETRDPRLPDYGPGFIRQDAEIAGVSLATEDGGWYFPFNHVENNCEWDVRAWLRDLLSFDRTYVFCNAMYDVEALWSMAATPGGRWSDIQLQQALLNEEFVPGYSLDAISNYWVGAGKDTSVLDKALAAYGFPDRGYIGYLPARYVGQYATVDAMRTLQSYRAQLPHISAEELGDVLELEENLLQLTWQMRLNGIRFDRERARYLREKFTEQSKFIHNTIYVDHGTLIDPRSSKAIAKYCDQNGVKYPRTEKGNPSFTGDFLENHKSPVLAGIAKIRKLDKMVNDFIDPWLLYSNTTGRIHAQWLLTASDEGGTKSGRLASKSPNMQQVPVRDPELGPLMRSLFLPNEGERWAKFDANNQEIRIAVHYAIRSGCHGTEAIQAAYRENPHLDFHQMVADFADVARVDAKTISLGTLYGMSQRKMSVQLGFSAHHAEEVYRRYFEAAPYFRELANMCMQVAEERGYVRTLLGRRRHFTGHQNLHKALNSVVQGTAADMIKQAMWDIWNEHQQVALLTVHDELGYSVNGACHYLAETIEGALTFEVPMVVDMYVGENWNVGK